MDKTTPKLDYRRAAFNTATAASGAATATGAYNFVTSEALTTAAGATYTLTLTNKFIGANSRAFVTLGLGTATAGTPVITTVTAAADTLTIVVQNIHSANALNGTITFAIEIVNPA